MPGAQLPNSSSAYSSKLTILAIFVSRNVDQHGISLTGLKLINTYLYDEIPASGNLPGQGTQLAPSPKRSVASGSSGWGKELIAASTLLRASTR